MSISASGPTPDSDPDQAPPDLLAALEQLSDTGKASAHAAHEAAKALRSLVAADVSLARSAFGRTLAMTGVAIVFGASAWMLLMAALVIWLIRRMQMPWSLALLGCGVLSLIIAALAAWIGQRYFEHTRLKATRRQLARLGIGELAKVMPDAGSSVSAKDAARHAPTKANGGQPLKDRRGVDVTPP